MKKILIIIFIIILSISILIAGFYLYSNHIINKSYTENNGDYVVLLHGLGRTSWSMQKMGRELAKNNYKVINIDYPSRSDNIENLVNNYLKKELEEKCIDKSKKINFVTHSMGGTMVKYLLRNNEVSNVGRVVMLAPPNSGSDLADKVSKTEIGNYIFGPALEELTTENNNSDKGALPAPIEVGIIAGEYDQKVSVEEAKLAGMTDFITFPKVHTWIMNDKEVINAVINFLYYGKFSPV